MQLRIDLCWGGGRGDLGAARGRGGGAESAAPLGRSWTAGKADPARTERPHVALVSRMLPQQRLLADRPALHTLWGRLCPA